jgi:hypothetical protein
MKKQTFAQTLHAALGLGIVATAAEAAPITIEPDNYVGLIGDVAPGATLTTFRRSGDLNFQMPVYSVAAGSWAPTGTRVFGHQTKLPGETTAHWDNLSEAYWCPFDPWTCSMPFYVFRVDFDEPAREVSILTTVRGEQAPDGIELQAFSEVGDRILRCHVFGVDETVLQTGVLPGPRYVVNGVPNGSSCGKVIQKKNCVGHRGNCDYVVKAILRAQHQQIHYAMAGGLLLHNSWANIDQLQYELD